MRLQLGIERNLKFPDTRAFRQLRVYHITEKISNVQIKY